MLLRYPSALRACVGTLRRTAPLASAEIHRRRTIYRHNATESEQIDLSEANLGEVWQYIAGRRLAQDAQTRSDEQLHRVCWDYSMSKRGGWKGVGMRA